MAKHLNPLEKEFLIHQFKRDPATKTVISVKHIRLTKDRPRQVIVSDMTAFKFWVLYFEVTFYFDVFTKEILTLYFGIEK